MEDNSVGLCRYTRNEMAMSPVFPDMASNYFERQEILFGYFQGVRRSIVKHYPIVFGWDYKNWITANFLSLENLCKENIFVEYSEISIVDYSETGFVELLALGFPFLSTWDRRGSRGNDLFEECLDKVRTSRYFS